MNATMTSSSSSRSTGTSRPAPRAWSMLIRALRAMARRRQARRDELFLRNQSDHLLRDIGIKRAEITAIVQGETLR